MLLEKRLIAIKNFPQWFKNASFEDARIKELFDSGYLFPFKDRDQNGCRVILFRLRLLDTKKFTADDSIRLASLISDVIMEEPETQIAGVVAIYDFKDVSMELLSVFSPLLLQKLVKNVIEVQPFRSKASYTVYLPSFACSFVELMKKLLSKKIQERSKMSSDYSAITNNIDAKILPLEYGGTTPIEEMLEDFRDKMKAHKKMISLTNEMDIDLARVKNFEPNDDVGSFRKLEFD